MSRIQSIDRRYIWAAGLIALTIVAAVFMLIRNGLVMRLFAGPDPTWSGMESRDIWRVGLDPSFPPFEMLDESGAPVGYDVDLAHEMASLWDMDVELVALGFDSLLDAVAAGKIDSAVSAMPYDPRSTKDYAYSSPYFEAGIRLVVREQSPIAGVADLDGKSVAVEWGSMGDMVGRRLHREGADIVLKPYATPEEAVGALSNDPAIDALLVDNVTLRQAQGSGAQIKAVGPALESNAYVIVMPLEAETLHEQVEIALATLHENGMLSELEDRWFGETKLDD